MSLADLPLYLHDQPIDDMALLRLYVDENSQDAFAELVERHASWIRAVCRRSLRDREYADDATQLVFIILARKAAQLSENTRVSGWLYRTTRFVLSDLRKRETRRRRRHTMAVRAAIERSSDGLLAYDPASSNGTRETVTHILALLPEHERQAVAMHFFDGLTFREIGEALGLSRDGAKKRVARALARLRNGNALDALVVAIGAALAAMLKAPSVAKAMFIATGKAVSSPAMILRAVANQISSNLAKLTMLRAATASMMVASALVYTTEAPSQRRHVASSSRQTSPMLGLRDSSLTYTGVPLAAGAIPSPLNVASPGYASAIVLQTSSASSSQTSQSQRPAMQVAQAMAGSSGGSRSVADSFAAPPPVDRHVNDRFDNAVALMATAHSSSGRAIASKSDDSTGDATSDPDHRAAESVARATPPHRPPSDDSTRPVDPPPSDPASAAADPSKDHVTLADASAGSAAGSTVGSTGGSTGGSIGGSSVLSQSVAGGLSSTGSSIVSQQSGAGQSSQLADNNHGLAGDVGDVACDQTSDHHVSAGDALEHTLSIDSHADQSHSNGNNKNSAMNALKTNAGDGTAKLTGGTIADGATNGDASAADKNGHSLSSAGKAKDTSKLLSHVTGHQQKSDGDKQGDSDTVSQILKTGTGDDGDYQTLGLTDATGGNSNDPADDSASDATDQAGLISLPALPIGHTSGLAKSKFQQRDEQALQSLPMMMSLLSIDPASMDSSMKAGALVDRDGVAVNSSAEVAADSSETSSGVLAERFSSTMDSSDSSMNPMLSSAAPAAGAVPEPASVLSLGALLAGSMLRRRSHRRWSSPGAFV